MSCLWQVRVFRKVGTRIPRGPYSHPATALAHAKPARTDLRRPLAMSDTVALVGSKLKRVKGLHKIDTKGKAVPGKVSELMLDFAAPLIDALERPHNIDDLQRVFMAASVCWNLPVLERTGDPEQVKLRSMLDDAMGEMPAELRALFQQLVVDREKKYGHIPFLVNLRVEADGPGFRLVAEAREAPRAAP